MIIILRRNFQITNPFIWFSHLTSHRGCLKRGKNHPVHALGVATPPSQGGENYGNQYFNFLLFLEEEYPDIMSGGGGGFFNTKKKCDGIQSSLPGKVS
jgi:hypothetical protein